MTVTSIATTPNANGYNNTSPVVVNLSAFDASGIASITYRINAGAPVTVAATTAAVSVPGNGIHTVTYSAKDNTGVDSLDQYQTVRIDTVLPAAPLAPTLTAASDTGSSSTDRISNDSTPTFSGTAEAGSTITLYNSGIAVGTAVVAADGTYAVTSSTLTSGTKTITVRNTDLAGNLGPASPSTTITLDYTAPSTPITPNLNSSSDSGRSTTDEITNDTTPTFTSDIPFGAASIRLYAAGVEMGSSATTTVTSSALADGVYAMTVRAEDTAGNLSSASSTETVTIDILAPAAPSAPVLAAASDTGSSSSDGITSDTTPTFTGTNESLAIVSLRENAAEVGTTTTTNATYTVTSSTMSNGDHTVTTTATDVAGNLGPASAGTTITIDTVAPTAPSAPVLTAASDSGVSSSDRITNDTTPTLTGTAAAGSIVTIFNGATPVGSAVTAIDGTYTITTDPLTSGNRNLTARTEPDTAGNIGVSASTTITIDVTAPTTPLAPNLATASDTGRSTSDENTNDATPTYTTDAPIGTAQRQLVRQ